MEDWAFLYRVAREMGLQLTMTGFLPSMIGSLGTKTEPVNLDMESEPTHDDILEIMARQGRISLDVVKQHPHGAMYPDPPSFVGAAEPGWQGRLELGNVDMMRDLSNFIDAPPLPPGADYDFRLICRRLNHVHNSVANVPETNQGRYYSPAFVHPDDLAALSVEAGERVELFNDPGVIVAVTEADPGMRRGVISMSHAFGLLDNAAERNDPLRRGSSTNWLTTDATGDPYTGQPLMTNIPVGLRRIS